MELSRKLETIHKATWIVHTYNNYSSLAKLRHGENILLRLQLEWFFNIITTSNLDKIKVIEKENKNEN